MPFSLAKHTADCLATILKESVELWELKGKVHAVVTDNTGNMVNGGIRANYHHVPCTAHFLQSTKYFRCLCKSQTNSSTSQTLLSLVLERLIERRHAILWLTPEISIHTELTSSEWSLLEHASFDLATLNISNENVTVTEVIPTVNGLKSELTTLTEQQHSGLKCVQKEMIHSSCCRFRSIETNNVFAVATLLVPRFKKTVVAELNACASATQHLIEEIRVYQCTPPANTTCGIPTDEEHDSKRLKGMLSIYSDIINKRSMPFTYRCPEAEVEMYLTEPPIPINSNPLQYRKTSPYTRLHKAAQKYLSSPAGSVASERLFSSAGLISSKKRSSLNPEKLRQLVFLNKNIYILKCCK
ncbi:hypothetical protein PR048_008887 [Dryococelus australis]|uniref:HAT C-terminal dimerisation domain-containing protein n=1 Tax=Dryococelus australis TaxID=614101 RepID=A0ABQ9I066_9NEOP|nr:hypothetical protein PR048_008887 [Dryococelus australis]